MEDFTLEDDEISLLSDRLVYYDVIADIFDMPYSQAGSMCLTMLDGLVLNRNLTWLTTPLELDLLAETVEGSTALANHTFPAFRAKMGPEELSRMHSHLAVYSKLEKKVSAYVGRPVRFPLI